MGDKCHLGPLNHNTTWGVFLRWVYRGRLFSKGGNVWRTGCTGGDPNFGSIEFQVQNSVHTSLMIIK